MGEKPRRYKADDALPAYLKSLQRSIYAEQRTMQFQPERKSGTN